MELNNLPEEILLQIFGYLSTYEIFKNIALVCKKFHRLSQDEFLIQEIYIGGKIDESCINFAYETLGRFNSKSFYDCKKFIHTVKSIYRLHILRYIAGSPIRSHFR